ncbi:LTA synthase family protein [Ureibacillus chungkukjangi]|uniref:Phosphoglycerol transferase MdoB-like AlkP superfamily enzyme n=1 Tax=Ureibacillus chungkukjangi TaxID=1202712 RepID=A0A318TK28_9BACL|nr:LTA synthase family protein [Ureibacillus chungkukjangi]PYF03498.1 phosphoglycerol transferase MdoB-like AlkP superfamily enzyme [Ureibacillus chungkukjangi]
MKSFKWPKHSILAIAIFATWLKTVIVYHTSFELDIENAMQELILIINPLSFILFAYGISLFFKTEKLRNRYLITVSAFLAIVLFANVGFYRFYNDFITFAVLFQTSNFGDLGNSVADIISFTDILYFADLIVLLIAIKFIPKSEGITPVRIEMRRAYFVLSMAIVFLNLGLSETERPQLLTRAFDRELLVKNIGTYNYHLYDIYVQSKSSAQRALADGSELVEVDNYVQANQAAVNPEMFGKYKGRNVILVSLESLQSFVINNEMNGEVVTPFLNSLTNDKDTYYFNDFYHQTGLGKTSDSEFIVENSLFGLGRGAVFFTHGGNTYNTMSEKLGENGYFTNVMHSNNSSFWNRNEIYESFNIDKFYDIESYEVTDENSVNWGLKDIPYFEQSVDLMKEMDQPFYSKMITLTNHYPFTLEEEDIMIPEYNSNSGTLNRYFQTVRYLDESIKTFFDKLKEEGLYDNSIIVMYGDHYGISENHNKAMSTYLGKEEITAYDSALLQSVPLFIHVPGSGDGQVMDEAAGQIDLRPTIMHLLGIETSNDMQLGADLFSEEHEDLVIFRDGRFITDDLVYAGEVCYDRTTGEQTEIEACQPYIERSSIELEYSDQIINGDLLRFYDEATGNLLQDALEVEEK